MIRREKQAKPRLNPDESDKLVRYAFLLSQATRLMENNEEAAQEWLDSPSPALGGQTPLECATTEVGARLVEDLITSLEKRHVQLMRVYRIAKAIHSATGAEMMSGEGGLHCSGDKL